MLTGLFALASVVGLLLAARHYWKPLSDQLAYLRYQRACLQFVDPPGTVVYEEDPDKSAKLLKASESYCRAPYLGTLAGTDWNPVVRIFPQELPWDLPPSICFIHSRDSMVGERLVMVNMKLANREATGEGRVVTFYAQAFKLAGLFSGQRRFPAGTVTSMELPDLEPGDELRLFGGQPDPADRTAFTVRFEVNDRPGLLQGKLAPDGKTAALSLRLNLPAQMN
jgi:hypothetical protein